MKSDKNLGIKLVFRFPIHHGFNLFLSSNNWHMIYSNEKVEKSCQFVYFYYRFTKLDVLVQRTVLGTVCSVILLIIFIIC